MTLNVDFKVTRGKALLDKIFTNKSDWYSIPTTLPAVGSSDHAAVLMLATHNPNYRQGADIIVTRRICDNNSKVLLVNALAKINWLSLYHIESCEGMTNCFYDTINALFDEYLPICIFKRHSSDKPWVTDRFRSLIKRWQYAFRTGNSNDYNKYRNASGRLAKKLNIAIGRLVNCVSLPLEMVEEC